MVAKSSHEENTIFSPTFDFILLTLSFHFFFCFYFFFNSAFKYLFPFWFPFNSSSFSPPFHLYINGLLILHLPYFHFYCLSAAVFSFMLTLLSILIMADVYKFLYKDNSYQHKKAEKSNILNICKTYPQLQKLFIFEIREILQFQHTLLLCVSCYIQLANCQVTLKLLHIKLSVGSSVKRKMEYFISIL